MVDSLPPPDAPAPPSVTGTPESPTPASAAAAPSRRRGCCGCLVLLAVVSALTLRFTAGPVVDRAYTALTRRAIPIVAGLAPTAGVELLEPSIETAVYTGWRGIAWTNLTTGLAFTEKQTFLSSREWQIGIDRLELTVDSWRERKLSLAFSGLLLMPARPAEWISSTRRGKPVHLSNFRFAGTRLVLPCRLSAWTPGGALALAEDLSQAGFAYLHGGRLPPDLVFEGSVAFTMNGRQFSIAVHSRPEDDGTIMVANTADLKRAVDAFGDSLTPAGLDLIGCYPFRIPQLLAIKVDAEQTAAEAFAPPSNPKRDAYRHILWSYLLCQEFGAVFAKKVTDAHEDGGGNTAEESRRDLRNNALGAEYWRTGIAETELLDRIDGDPRVALRGR